MSTYAFLRPVKRTGKDPLNVLREFISNNKDIVEYNDLFIFGDIAYYKNAVTNFKIFSVNKDVKIGYYNLETLKYLFEHEYLHHAAYIKRAITRQREEVPSLQIVTRADRSNVLDYLTGKTDTSQSIDPNAPIELPMTAPEIPKKEKKRHAPGGTPAHRTPSRQTPRPKVQGPVSSEVHQVATVASTTKSMVLSNCDALMSLKLPEPETLFKARTGPEGPTSSSTTPTIVNAMGKDKILELKAKRRAVKISEIGHVAVDGDFVPPPQMTSAQEDALGIMKYERVHQNRITILCSSNVDTNLYKSVMNVLNRMHIRQERIAKFGPGPHSLMFPSTKITIHRKPDPTLPYSRYDQTAADVAETADFEIDPLKTFSKNFVDEVKKTLKNDGDEEPIQTQTRPMGAKIFSTSMKLRPSSSSSSSAKRPRRELTPIIIVPEVPPSLITILNAQNFLEECSFVTHESKKTAGAKRVSDVIMHRNRPTGSVPYKITSTPERLSLHDWDRVVAVFVTGKTWQFKGWPWEANPVEICNAVSAYHLKYDDANLDANVRQWSVNVIQISKLRRHLDKAAVVEFWNSLDSFIAKRKPYLRT